MHAGFSEWNSSFLLLISVKGVWSLTSEALSRFAESDALGSPNGPISCSRPRHTGDCRVASLDRIQFKFPCKESRAQ